MSQRTKRNTTVVDYKQLAGMSKSVKSAGSKKSGKSKKVEEFVEVIATLDQALQKDVEAGLGDTVTSDPLPANIHEEEVFKSTMQAHEEEEKKLEEKRLEVTRRQEMIDKRKKVSEQRRELEAQLWEQKLALQEMKMEDSIRCIELMEREERMKAQKLELQLRADKIKQKQQIREKEEQSREKEAELALAEDKAKRTQEWIVHSDLNGLSSGKPRVQEGDLEHVDRNIMVQKELMGPKLSESQRIIRDLEAEVSRLKAEDPRGAPLVGAQGGIAQLRQMGLMATNVPDDLSQPPPPPTGNHATEYRGSQKNGRQRAVHTRTNAR